MATSYIIKSEGSQLHPSADNLGDWNNAMPGDFGRLAFYCGASWANSAPDMLFAIVMKFDENNIVQIGSGPSGVFYRKRNWGTWSAWEKLGGGYLKPYISRLSGLLKGGAWHDEHHQKTEGFASRDERMGTDSHDSYAARNLSIPDHIWVKNSRLPDVGKRHGLYPRRGILSGGNDRFCSDGRPWRYVGLLGSLLPVSTKGVA